MGDHTYDPRDWTAYSAKTSTKSRDAIYTSRGLKPKLDPKNIKFRESRDSKSNPNSTPIIVDFDVTGSMGVLAETIAKTALGPMFQEIYTRKPVSDPHIMFMANGDSVFDRSPLQVSQFEAGHKEIVEQLEQVYLEGGGGNNDGESYTLPWYFGARKTIHDSWEKRKQKGYLFTIGDEPYLPTLTKQEIQKVFGDDVQSNFTAQELLDMVSKTYNVYHLIVMQGSYARVRPDHVKKVWRNLLGQNAIELTNINDMAQVIVSVLEVANGKDKDAVIGSWSGTTAVTVADAVKDMVATKGGTAKGVVRF